MAGNADARTVKRLYVEEGLSRDRMALRLGVPRHVITSTLRRSGVEIRPPITPSIVTELTTSNPLPPRILSCGGKVIVRHQVRLTTRLAYVLGWIIGDGYVNRREIDAIVSLRELTFIEPFVRAVLERHGKVYVVPRHGTHIFRCDSTKLARVLCTAAGQRYWKNIDFVLDSPRFASAFIAGFWDADGGVFHESNGVFRAHLYNSNLVLLEKVASALIRHFGIEVKVYKRKTSKSPPTSKIQAQSDRFDLYVPVKGNTQWANRIGRRMLLPWKRPRTQVPLMPRESLSGARQPPRFQRTLNPLLS
jgi:hypothetical protein